MKIGTELEINELDTVVGGSLGGVVKEIMSLYYVQCLLASKPAQHLAGSTNMRDEIFH